MSLDLLLVAITPASMPPDQLISQCRCVEAGGATSVQLRLKDRPSGEIFSIAQSLITALNIPVYVNDRTDIALAVGAAGVHVGATDLPARCIRMVAPRPFRVGISVGTSTEAQRALDADADYWSIGPFASTQTKTDAGAALGFDGFASLVRFVPHGIPVVAIGGIDPQTAPRAIEAGATGVAAVSALFEEADVKAATLSLRRVVERALERREESGHSQP